MVDINEEIFIQSIMENMQIAHVELEDRPKIGFWQLMRIRWLSIKQGISEPIVKHFYFFLLLQGLMPDFADFNYYFSIEVMKISLMDIGFGTIIVGIVVIAFPVIYIKFMKDWEFRRLFF